MDIIKKRHAKALGLEWYFTGKPCKRGHLVKRSVVNGNCQLCTNIKAREWRGRNPEHDRIKARIWNAENPDRVRAARLKRQEANPEKYREQAKNWRKNNPDKARIQWASRMAQKKGGLVPLNKIEKFRVKQLYTLRRQLETEFGIPFHVDHIVSFTNGGKHHPDNMRVITKRDNLAKNNRDDYILQDPYCFTV